MFDKLHAIFAIIRGKNTQTTPVSVISQQMNELRPLPIGMSEFEVWADRIISGAMLPADNESQKFALANELLSLGPTQDFKEDIYFIKLLRKFAVNQIADAKRTEIREQVKARLAAAEEAANQLAAQNDPTANGSQVPTTTQGEVTIPNLSIVANDSKRN